MATQLSLTDNQPSHLSVANALLADFRAGKQVDRDWLRKRFESQLLRTAPLASITWMVPR